METEFRVIQITAEMIRADEQMGSKDKFWVELPDQQGGGRWLFKEPRSTPGNIEHVAEKLAQEIASLLKVPCARIELGEFGQRRGTLSRSVLGEGESLVHGNEIIAGRVDGYDRKAKRRSTNHTFERVCAGISEACAGRRDEDLTQFAGYLILDAVIGNTDRHHENWAVLRRDPPPPISYRLAPSFDHASSLGRELQDHRRLLLLKEKRVGDYLRQGEGAVYLTELGEQPIAPITLVEKLYPSHPALFNGWLAALVHVTADHLDSIIQKVPENWASSPQRDFARAMVLEAKQKLISLVQLRS